MKHLFVPSDIALMAKEKGFDELCFGSFNPTLNIWDPPFASNSMLIILNDNDKVVCAAPLYQQLIDWFRDEHKILIRPEINGYDYEIIMITNFNTLHRGFDNIDLALRQAFELI